MLYMSYLYLPNCSPRYILYIEAPYFFADVQCLKNVLKYTKIYCKVICDQSL